MNSLKFLKKSSVFVLVFLLQPSPFDALANVDFSLIPPAKTAQESIDRFDARTDATVDYWLAQPVGVLTRAWNSQFYSPAIARVVKGIKLDEVEKGILDPGSVPYALVGSDFRDLGPICRRVGDYDFALQGLVNLAFQIKNHKRHISPEAWTKLLHTLLSEKGSKHHTHFTLKGCGTYKDSENHVLLSESSRFLTNQLLYEEGKQGGKELVEFDNIKNGFEGWLLTQLQQLAKHDFVEYNSRPYQGFTFLALQNLYDYSESEKVKIAAKGLLDYLAAKYAIQSNLLRRLAPFGRQPRYATSNAIDGGDIVQYRFAVQVGNYDIYSLSPKPYEASGEPHFMLLGGVTSYRIPPMILDLFFDKSTAGPYFQKYSHYSAEIYEAHDRYLVSAGGIFYNNPQDWILPMMDGWAYPTTIMPTGLQMKIDDLIRIKGSRVLTSRSNMCMQPGFACGIDPTIPKSIPASCREKIGNFTFIDFTSDKCPLKYGFHVAVYSKTCDGLRCFFGGTRFGFWETHDPKPGETFADFKKTVLKKNGGRKYRSYRTNDYYTYDGRKISFTPVTWRMWDWGIRFINDNPVYTKIKDWGLAEGDIVMADHSGLITMKNPKLNQTIRFDFRNANEPAWELK